jgi:succinate dehydrogenase/fumarate reductase flavoprotein subunit
MYDIIVIGGGVIGGFILRELTKYNQKVCLLEKESDVSMGQSRANSGIVHAGFDAKEGTNKAKFNDVYNCLHNDNFPSKNKTHLTQTNNTPDAFDEMFSHYFTGIPQLNQHTSNTNININNTYNKRSKSFKEIKAFNYKQHKMRSNNNTTNPTPIDRKMNINVYNKIENNKTLLNYLFKSSTHI